MSPTHYVEDYEEVTGQKVAEGAEVKVVSAPEKPAKHAAKVAEVK